MKKELTAYSFFVQYRKFKEGKVISMSTLFTVCSTLGRVLFFLLQSGTKKKGIAIDMSASMITVAKEKIIFLKIVRLICPNVKIITQTTTYSYTDHEEIFQQANQKGIQRLLYFTDGYDVPANNLTKVNLIVPRKWRTQLIRFMKKTQFQLKVALDRK